MATIAKRLYDDHLIYLNENLKADEQDMLLEFSLGVDWKDVVQFALAGAAEYGLDFTVVGAPASFAADTAVDVLFAGTEFMGTIESFRTLEDQFQQGKEIMARVFESRQVLQNGFEAYYNHIRDIWANVQDLFPAGTRDLRGAIRLAKEAIKKGIEQISKRIAQSIGTVIKLVIPDAAVGFAISATLKTLMVNLSENAYSLLTGAINRSSTLTNFLTNPETAKDFFERMYDGLVSFLEQTKTKMESDSGWSLRRGLYGIAGGLAGVAAAGSPLGQRAMIRGLSALIQRLRTNRNMFLRIINGIFDFVIPSLFGLLATHQILMRDDLPDPEERALESAREEYQQLNEATFYRTRLQLLAGIKT